MKKRVLLSLAIAALLPSAVSFGETRTSMSSKLSAPVEVPARSVANEPLIQIALLLDTSGSMKGLVDQARSQLWNVVSDLSQARLNGDPIRLEIAVYQFGTEEVSKSRGCLRRVVSFTENLDEVSEGLFSLRVGGGDEFCGQVIGAAVEDLDWSEDSGVYKTIFVAGNEYFDQGNVTFGEILPEIQQKSILVNAIYCGTKYQGQEQWDSAAQIAGGVSALIDHNHHLPKMPTPYDTEMRELNELMNETFVWFGKGAERAARKQREQDKNAAEMSDHAFASRMSTKAGHLYHHVDHDLVDALRHGKADLETMPESLMPSVLRDKSPSDRQGFMEEMIAQRKTVRRRMAEVLSLRQIFLENELRKQGGNAKTVLGDALSTAIKLQAKMAGYKFAEEAKTQLSQTSP